MGGEDEVRDKLIGIIPSYDSIQLVVGVKPAQYHRSHMQT